MRPTRTNTTATNTTRARIRDDGGDPVARYMRDIRQEKRLSRDEETVLVADMLARREEIAELLRAVLLKACDTLGVDTGEGSRSCARAEGNRSTPSIETYLAELPKLRQAHGEGSHEGTMTLRTSIACLADKARLRGLETVIATIAELVRRETHELERGTTNAARVFGDISASFGVSAEDIDRIAASIAERRRLIQQATQRLVESNLRLVVYFAQRAQWRGVDVADLVQEGNIALMKAVESFDPHHGLAFGTFATIGVCRAIHRFGATAAQVVYVPREVWARHRRVQKTADYLSQKQGGAPSWDAVAEYLEVSRGEVAEALEAEETISLDSSIDGAVPIVEMIPDQRVVDAMEALAAGEQDLSLREALAKLDDRSRGLIESRYGVDRGEQSSLAQIGQELGVTRERVRQLEGGALRQLRTRGSGRGNRRP